MLKIHVHNNTLNILYSVANVVFCRFEIVFELENVSSLTAMSSSNYHNNTKFRNCAENEGFWKELKASYNDRSNDPKINRLSSRFCTIYFWFTAITEIHVIVNYVIPTRFADYSDICQYYMKVACWFVFIQVVANWACLMCYDTSYKASADRPHARYGNHQAMQVSCTEPSKTDNMHRFPDKEYNSVDWNNVATGNGYTQDKSVKIDVDDGEILSSKKLDEESRILTRWWCTVCQHKSPPRAHHCVVCNKCILKRDHHCYMTGVCIGYYNQRYFVVLSGYTALASGIGLYFIVEHLYTTFATTASHSDYILPVTFYRWLVSGTVELHHLLMLCHVYTLWWSGLAGGGFFCWQLAIIATGKTTFEVRKEVRVRSTSSVAENFQSVFGHFWGLNFVLPAQILFRQTDDGSNWNMKPA